MRVPSGDHSAPLPSTRARSWVPSAFMVQMADSRESVCRLTQPRV